MLPSISLSLALLVLDAAAAAPPQRREPEPLHIPIVRRHNARRGGVADMDRFAVAAQKLKDKYGYGRTTLSRRTTTDFGMTNHVNYPAHISEPGIWSHVI